MKILLPDIGASFERRVCSIEVNWNVLLNLLVPGKAPAKPNYYFCRSEINCGPSSQLSSHLELDISPKIHMVAPVGTAAAAAATPPTPVDDTDTSAAAGAEAETATPPTPVVDTDTAAATGAEAEAATAPSPTPVDTDTTAAGGDVATPPPPAATKRGWC